MKGRLLNTGWKYICFSCIVTDFRKPKADNCRVITLLLEGAQLKEHSSGDGFEGLMSLTAVLRRLLKITHFLPYSSEEQNMSPCTRLGWIQYHENPRLSWDFFLMPGHPLLAIMWGKSFLFFICFSSFFYCSGFCHTLKWNSHGFTCVPHSDPPSHLPLHPIPLGLPSAPGPSACLMDTTWAGDLFHPR